MRPSAPPAPKRPRAQPKKIRAQSPSPPSAASDRRRVRAPARPTARPAYLFPPPQHPLHEHEIDPVGDEPEQRDRENDGKHRIIGAAGAEKADEIAQPLARRDQLGADQED